MDVMDILTSLGVAAGLLCTIVGTAVNLLGRISAAEHRCNARIDAIEDRTDSAIAGAIVSERANGDRVYALRADVARMEARLGSMEQVLSEIHEDVRMLRH